MIQFDGHIRLIDLGLAALVKPPLYLNNVPHSNAAVESTPSAINLVRPSANHLAIQTAPSSFFGKQAGVPLAAIAGGSTLVTLLQVCISPLCPFFVNCNAANDLYDP